MAQLQELGLRTLLVPRRKDLKPPSLSSLYGLPIQPAEILNSICRALNVENAPHLSGAHFQLREASRCARKWRPGQRSAQFNLGEPRNEPPVLRLPGGVLQG